MVANKKSAVASGQGKADRRGRRSRRPSRNRRRARRRRVTIDRRENRDRRLGADRRTHNVPVAVERRVVVQRRVKVNRRRQIDPTTCERDYTPDEIEFMGAMDEYKRRSGRMFPTCSEVLEVIKSLGYEKCPKTERRRPAGPRLARCSIESQVRQPVV